MTNLNRHLIRSYMIKVHSKHLIGFYMIKTPKSLGGVIHFAIASSFCLTYQQLTELKPLTKIDSNLFLFCKKKHT